MKTLITFTLAISFAFLAQSCQRLRQKQQRQESKGAYKSITVPEPKPASEVNFSDASNHTP
ncbi:MAG: hypothetical protein HC855_15705 [Rhizobiales bacterium]|nr:hypothetical protein [Hyphomicrobiales bacterium]